MTGTVQQLADALFGARSSAEALIAQDGAAIAGFALFYTSFSTWECRPGIWLEDLFVRPEHRRAGVGGRLLGELARVTIDRGYPRLEWNALDWNELAQRMMARGLNPFFQIQSLRDFNQRFNPEWVSRSVVIDDVSDLPRIALLYASVEGFLEVPLLGRALEPPIRQHVMSTVSPGSRRVALRD